LGYRELPRRTSARCWAFVPLAIKEFHVHTYLYIQRAFDPYHTKAEVTVSKTPLHPDLRYRYFIDRRIGRDVYGHGESAAVLSEVHKLRRRRMAEVTIFETKSDR
jgi:hypothetical protein